MRHKYLAAINDKKVTDVALVEHILCLLRADVISKCTLKLTTDDTDALPLSQTEMPQIYFDQMHGVHSHLAALRPLVASVSDFLLDRNWDQPESYTIGEATLDYPQARLLASILSEVLPQEYNLGGAMTNLMKL